MSVKAMSLVWDLECPKEYNGVSFKPNHKYVLFAYADHADHFGKNIWPAIGTIAKKTGLEDRTVQRLTADLEGIGLLVEDGQGPRGTNKWKMPFSGGGDKLSPLSICHPDKNDDSLGDIPSGDNPSGDNLSPELKEPEPNQSLINKDIDMVLVWDDLKRKVRAEMPKVSFDTWIEPTDAINYDGRTLTISAWNAYARDWLDSRLKTRAQELLGLFVNFVVTETEAGD
jgi:hypothetical protein